jgi:acetyltransferase-like isoleucine patch superfamily enzyme
MPTFANSILFNHAQAPHFNYVGDSVLGFKSHLGAGVKISNFKVFPGNVTVEMDGRPFDTGLRKFGALLGDHCEIGCNAVLAPGSVIGRGSVIYPNVSWRGILPEQMIVKYKAAHQIVSRRDRGA